MALLLLGSDFEKADFHVAGPRRDAHVSPRERLYDLAGFRPTAGRYRRQGPHLGPGLPPSACHSSATSRAPQRADPHPAHRLPRQPAARRIWARIWTRWRGGASCPFGRDVRRPARPPLPAPGPLSLAQTRAPRSYQREVTRSTISCSGSSVRPRSRCLPWISIAKSASCERGLPNHRGVLYRGGIPSSLSAHTRVFDIEPGRLPATHRGTYRRQAAACWEAMSAKSARQFRHQTGCRRDRSAASSGVPMTEPTGFAHGGDVPQSHLSARGRSADVEGRSHLTIQPKNGDGTQTIQAPAKPD